MAEQTTPEGSPQAAPSVEQRLVSFLAREPEKQPDEAPEQAAEAPQEQPQGQAQEPGELMPDDIPGDDAAAQPQSVEGFEIVHNGQQRKLSREETIRLAQQGFDYTQKTQNLAQMQRQVEANLARANEAMQLAPLVANDLAQVKAFEAQLSRFQQVDWVKLATDDPLEYPKYRAQYDQLNQAYQAARGQFQQRASELTQRQQALTRSRVEQELPKLLERIPEWRDPQKYQAGAAELRSWLVSEGADETVVDGLSDAVAISIAAKAMKYDKLVKAKAGKVKQLQTAPPVTRPGASDGQGAAKADKDRQLRDRLKKSGDLQDAAALYLNRMK